MEINPDNLPNFELLIAGFPCQTFSVIGRRQGMNDDRGLPCPGFPDPGLHENFLPLDIGGSLDHFVNSPKSCRSSVICSLSYYHVRHFLSDISIRLIHRILDQLR